MGSGLFSPLPGYFEETVNETVVNEALAGLSFQTPYALIDSCVDFRISAKAQVFHTEGSENSFC